MTYDSNPHLPEIATALGAAVTEAYLLAAQAPAGRMPVPPVGWQRNATEVSGYLRLSGVWENFGLWYQNASDPGQWLLALRGTVTRQDAYVDGDIHPTTLFQAFAPAVKAEPAPQVHPGFWNLYCDTQIGNSTPSMQAQIFQFLEPLVNSGVLHTLYISGHSLGGALAELLSLDLALSRWTGVNITTVTFAAPKVGLQQSWATLYAGQVQSSFAVINQYDIVPTQPKIHGWSSVGTPFDLRFYHDPHDSSETELVIRHSMSNHLFVLQKAINAQPQQWQGCFSDSLKSGFIDTSEIASAEILAIDTQRSLAINASLVAP